ncbi:SCP-like protein [Ancylostoma duodenale]|uniref:SCP-like protein n=1 Tax=Ancylostoma duodenale TaxID=51022 RepID=A0A0C2GCC6_9BILA|nr:SCP-like protein [Ancylostoma duodenale]
MRRKILDFHNKVRTRLVEGQEKDLPKAKRMRNLTWDCNLEKKAESEFTTDCLIDPKKVKNRGFNQYVQDSYDDDAKITYGKDLKPALNWWWDRRSEILKRSNVLTHEGLLPFANMANEKNKKIGCTYKFDEVFSSLYAYTISKLVTHWMV